MLIFDGDPLSDSDRLKYIRNKIAGLSQQKFSEKINFPTHKIRDIEIGKIKISVELALVLEEIFLCDFRWVLTGQGRPEKYSGGNDGSPDVVELRHVDIVKAFQNKELAKEINEILLEIEDVDSDHLREVKGLLRSELDHVRAKQGQKRATAEGE